MAGSHVQGMRGLYQGFGASMTNTAVTVACVCLSSYSACHRPTQLGSQQRLRLRRLGFTSYEVGVDIYRKLHNGHKPNPGEAGCPALPRHLLWRSSRHASTVESYLTVALLLKHIPGMERISQNNL